MNILELDHIQLAMPTGGEAQARAFYGVILGFDELRKPEPLASRGGCWFQHGAIQIHLGVETPFSPARKAHPALIVADLDQARRELAAAGIDSLPDDTIAGVRRCYASDPFGNRIEFIQDGHGFNQPENRRPSTR